MDRFLLGKGQEDCFVRYDKLNRHGVVAGATGTGKTVTLKVMAESLSDAGIPVFLADIKGDLSSLCEKADPQQVGERVTKLGLTEWEPTAYPVEFFDVFQKDGIPVRTTVSEMGPLLLSRLLGLNDVQEGILNIVFRVADDRGLLLIDLKDLRAMLNEVKDRAKELERDYGLVSASSVAAIQRGILALEDQGGNLFFGEPDFDVEDFMRTRDGKGVISILSCGDLFRSPKLYSTFLMWLLSEIYESLPEVGDPEKPKLVFFFDEAHVLFDDSEKVLLEKIEQMVRLIRSKGVGIFFVSQSPMDIPDSVLAQLGNKIQHGMRAYTPKEQKNLKAIAASMRSEDENATYEAILSLGTGEAVVSVLDEKSVPTEAQRVWILPPQSKLTAVDPQKRLEQINRSELIVRYGETVDRESAYEILEQARIDAQMEREREQRQKEEERLQKEEEKRIAQEERQERQRQRDARANRSFGDKMRESVARNVFGTVGREVGRQITRGIFGTIFKK